MGFLDLIFGSNNHRLQIHNHGHRCYLEGLNFYERELVSLLAKELDPQKYFIFNNITVPSSDTITSQIDHIIISEFGIFVIESKDYSGWIFGNKDSKTWTATYTWGKKFTFQNPLFQNFAHVSALKEQLPFLQKCFFSVAVFSRGATFKTERVQRVLYDDELIDFIKSKDKKWLREEEVMLAIGKLSILCQTHRISNDQHVKNLKATHLNTIPYQKDRIKNEVPIRATYGHTRSEFLL